MQIIDLFAQFGEQVADDVVIDAAKRFGEPIDAGGLVGDKQQGVQHGAGLVASELFDGFELVVTVFVVEQAVVVRSGILVGGCAGVVRFEGVVLLAGGLFERLDLFDVAGASVSWMFSLIMTLW